MRLLERASNGDLAFREFTGEEIPRYAILSHTWGNEEVSLQDVEMGNAEDKAGWEKIEYCAERANADGLRYIWVDTCCIDRRNAVELSEAINSMFRWYQDASRCYVHLSDVSVSQDNVQDAQTQWVAAFRESRWFKRGWTLQELIAPPSVEFFCADGRRLGDKEGLAQVIHEITGIPITALRGATLSEFNVDERMLWAQGRTTTRPEDIAYSLLGIFDVYLTPIYGEGRRNAVNRLQREIERRATEAETDFARSPLLNPHPVRRNYRRAIVLLISWECDCLEATVQNIARVFRELYHYEVRETLLTLDQQSFIEDDFNWPWPDETEVEDADLQIVYYVGGTRSLGDQHVLIVLDAYTGEAESGSMLHDNDRPWARYGIVCAGYADRSNVPGSFSTLLMSALENLAHSGQMVNVASVMRRLEEERHTLASGMQPARWGNHGNGSIILSPI